MSGGALTLSGQRVVVIGGSSGIGLAVARGALADGAEVVVASSGAAKVEAAAAKLGAGARGAVVDVTDEASVAVLFEGIGALRPPGLHRRRLGAADDARPSRDPRLRHGRRGAESAVLGRDDGGEARPAADVGRGSIVLTDGVLAHRPPKGQPLIAAFGGAIEHLVRGLAVDLAPIRVNAVCPGLTLTEQWAQAPVEMIQQMTGRQPLPRAAETAEVAEAYLYAMRGGYTTGQVLIVDGGALLV